MRRYQFQHLTNHNGQRATMCILLNEYDPIAVGYAVCSKKDQFTKKRGRESNTHGN